MDGEIFRGMGRETDSDYVDLIVRCLKRPLKNPDPRYENPEKYIAREVHWYIEILRIEITRKPSRKLLTADDRKLIGLLRRRRWHDRADEIEFDLIGPPTPHPRSKALKHKCAWAAYDLMLDFTEEKPKDYRKGKCQEIAALFYDAITQPTEPTEPEEMERACARIIQHYADLDRRNAAKKAREAKEKARDAGPPMPPAYRKN